MKIVVTGIGTGVGKTVASAILTKALNATYWKPVQAGDLHDSDSMKVAKLTSCTVQPERFALKFPASPHWSAQLEEVTIDPEDLQLPEIDGNLVIEGAGGVMVPLNEDGLLYIDLFQKWDLPIVIISRHYLGSINHTLLTVEAIKKRNLTIKGILFIGDEHPTTESIIAKASGVNILGRIPEVDNVDEDFITAQADLLKSKF